MTTNEVPAAELYCGTYSPAMLTASNPINPSVKQLIFAFPGVVFKYDESIFRLSPRFFTHRKQKQSQSTKQQLRDRCLQNVSVQ